MGRPGSVHTVALTACDGLLRGALITGRDRVYLGMLAWINYAFFLNGHAAARVGGRARC